MHDCYRMNFEDLGNHYSVKIRHNENARIVTDKHTVKLPLRVNWGGGWSDTPP